ncbi:MAG: HAMP domain-containing histidine kinase [Microbacteriaceae bacterium]|nr:MAG: HAMP domain-containing histidine kinase [Microbacteriaceae bacterium]
MPSWLRSLTGRIVLVTITVALISVVISALVSVQLIQATIVNDARAQLRAEVVTLSTQPLVTARVLARDARTIDPGGGRFALIAPDGAVTGAAARFVSGADATRVLAGRKVSLIRDSGGESVVVEAVPRPGGGAVVGVRAIADIRAAGAGFVPWTVLALVAGLLAGILAGVLLARRIARPLVRTAASARRMALGQRGVPLEEHTIAEIDDVSRALGGLDAALAASEARQREFLMAVSHEIRTPLTAVRGYAQALAEGIIEADETAAVGQTLVAEAARLDRFVADLLELARLEADDFGIELGDVQLLDLVGAAAGAWRARCRQVGVDLRVETPDAGIVVRTDAMRVRQIIDGLVENALRVTPVGGIVVIAVAEQAGSARLEVRDSGPGLSEEDRQVAFERGVLNDRYRGVRPVGTGLGLSIAARLVANLGGTVAASAAAEGGACFRIELPILHSSNNRLSNA